MNLNSEQKLAVEHFNGPCLVLAGPGSGKTRVISHRIINLIEKYNVPPTRILAISFTKLSSLDIKEKTLKLSNNDKINKVNFGTFHSIFFRILRRYDNVSLEDLISESDRYKLAKYVLRQLKVKVNSDDEITDFLSEISYVKNELMDPQNYFSNVFEEVDFEELFYAYEDAKNNMNKIDFDDMLIRTYNLLINNSGVLEIVSQVFKYILIDEFQDINRVQFEVIKLISTPLNNLFVVGDEDQSIYGFRGARPDFMIDFSNHFSGSIKINLKTNYRSVKGIVLLSQKLIKHNKNRYNKDVEYSITDEGKIAYNLPIDVDEEAKYISQDIMKKVKNGMEYSDFAVLYRANIQSRALVDSFLENRIPFVLKDSAKSIYDHWVSLDIIAYLRASMEIASNEEWARIINRPFRYISKNAIKNAVNSEDFLSSLINSNEIKDFQKRDLNDLYEDLNYIKGLTPEYGISYIRSTLDYDRYVLEYCHERKIKAKEIVDILDDLENSSKSFRTILEFFKHIDEVRREIKKNSEMATKNLNTETEGVVLSTMHSSKGLEFSDVYIVGVNDGTVPFLHSDDEGNTDIEEERRLFYVGITRAKNNLTISIPQKKFNKKVKVSRFIEELEEKTDKKI